MRMRSPLLLMAASFVLGIFLVGSAHLPGPAAAAIPVCVAVCLVAGLLVMRAGWERLSLIFALLGFLAAGASASCLFEYRFPETHVSKLAARGVDLEQPVRLDGHIASTPLRTAYGLQFDLETERAESRTVSRDVTGKVRLRLEASEGAEAWALVEGLHLQYGDAVRLWVRLRKPRIYQNPGSFDFRRWMESTEDIYWVGTIKNPLLIEKLPGADERVVRASRPQSRERPAPALEQSLSRAERGNARSTAGETPALQSPGKNLRMTVSSLAPVFSPSAFSTFAEGVRSKLLRSIDDLYPRWSAQGRCGSVLKAVLLGDRSALDSETIESFRKTGLYHLLVIAGLHVGLLALLADGLLRLVRLGERARRLTVLALLIFYAFLVEQRAATLRATLMIALYLLARLLYRSSSTLNSIGLAALVLLLWRPAWLFESGFQLSFSAALLIAGLAVPILERTTEPYRRALRGLDELHLDEHLAPRLAQFRLDLRALIAWLKSRWRVLERHQALARALVTGPARVLLWTANILLFSAVLQVGLLLPMATTFHRVALAGIGLNALAIPVMTVLLALAVPTVVLAVLVPALAVWPAKALAAVMAGLFALTDLPHLPAWLSFRVPNPPFWVSCGFVLFILATALALGKRPWVFGLSLAGLGVMTVLVATHPFSPRLPSGTLEVTALDCGQGESLFVVLPDRTTMLVDGCGSRHRGTGEGAVQGRLWDPGEDIVSPYLWSRGIEKIDIVVLSIPHEDRLGGLFAVARNFRIGEFWHAENTAGRAYWDLLEKLRAKGVAEQTLVARDKLERGGATVRVLWPEGSHRPAASFSNDDSLVLRVAYGGDSVLLTGDITAKAERELLDSGGKAGGFPHRRRRSARQRQALVLAKSCRVNGIPGLRRA